LYAADLLEAEEFDYIEAAVTLRAAMLLHSSAQPAPNPDSLRTLVAIIEPNSIGLDRVLWLSQRVTATPENSANSFSPFRAVYRDPARAW
jgi:hypothetical protein